MRTNRIFNYSFFADNISPFLADKFVDRALVNGSFRELFAFRITSDGSVITGTLTNPANPPSGIMTMQFSDGDTELETPATVTITAGTEANPQGNWVYIPVSTKVLTVSTSAWVDEEHIKIAFIFAQSASDIVVDGGTIINQNINNELEDNEGQGHLTHITEKLRILNATYFDGIDPDGDASTYLVNTAGDSRFKSTSGSVFQMHKQVFPAFSTAAGETIHVKNWFGSLFNPVQNLFDIVADSTGTTIGNNKYFNLVFWGVQNKTDEHQTVIINLPGGFYNTQSGAVNDVSGFDDFTIPREFNIDSSVGFLIARITIKMGATWTTSNTVDLRGTNPQTATGGVAGIVTDFSDLTFSIFNDADDSKVLDFAVSAVSAGNTRTITMADFDVDLAGLVPYTGATANVDLGIRTLETDGLLLHEPVKDEIVTFTATEAPGQGVNDGNITINTRGFNVDIVFNSGGDFPGELAFNQSLATQSSPSFLGLSVTGASNVSFSGLDLTGSGSGGNVFSADGDNGNDATGQPAGDGQGITITCGDGGSGFSHQSGDGGSITMTLGSEPGDFGNGAGVDGQFIITNLPSSDPGIVGALYHTSGTVKISI